MNESPLLLGVESSGGGLSSPFLGNGNAASSVVFIKIKNSPCVPKIPLVSITFNMDHNLSLMNG